MCKSETKTESQQNGNTSHPRDQEFTWEQVAKHTEKHDKWLVIDNEVYDITRWSLRHPGGSKVISHYAGQDASEAFRAFHNDKDFVRKFMRAIHIGHIRKDDRKEDDMKRDFEQLRQTAIDMGLFKVNVFFFLAHFAHIVGLEFLTYATLYYFGTGWIPWLTALALVVTVQAQAGWSQHDYGHQSVFNSFSLNNLFHRIVICFMKGAGSDWWKHMHYQHHSKPNVMGKDPDVRLDALLVVGDVMAEKVAKKKRKSVFFNLPFGLQDRYFFFSLPPLLFPTYFQYRLFAHTIQRKKWQDLAWMILYYIKFAIVMTWLLGGVWPMLKFYFAMRVVESHWFVWVTQSNHIPMEVDYDHDRPWIAQQLSATCNVEQSFFNDWFTGHLNFQIEHHLFPTMPRHNLHKIQPLVQSLCKKHGLDYQIKPLLTAFVDIVKQLKHSGEVWEHYYEAYHLS